MRTLQAASLLLLLGGFTAARPAAAQSTARSPDIETSIRAAGMGGATTAVGWGEPGPWGNPASLAGTRGIAWLSGSTNLSPALAGDVKFESSRFLLGGAGLGFSIMGQPVSGMGRTRLDYDSNQGTDPIGNPTTSDSYEEIEGWGGGVSPVQLIDVLRARRDPDSHPWSTHADVSFGYQSKETQLFLAPGAEARARNSDWGVQATIAVLPGDTEGREARLELAAGYALLNADEQSEFDFGGAGGTAPSSRIERTGVALHATLPFAGAADEGGAPWGWWFATVPRAVEIGFAYDRESRSTPGLASAVDVDHLGCEASLMGLLAGRIGFVNDSDIDVSGMSFGFGVHLPIGPWASVGYDWASVPQPQGIDATIRNGFAVWLHPIALWRATRE